MPKPAKRVAVVAVMSRVETWRCQWPTNGAPAVPEEPIEAVGPELALAVLVTTAGLETTAVVEDVPVPGIVFEHPTTAVTIPATAMTNPETNPDFTTKTCAVIRRSLQSRATTPRAQSTDGIRPKD
jgi:hypothetical protein